MEINVSKSTLSTHLLGVAKRHEYLDFFPFSVGILEGRLKYLGFRLKPNNYRKHDWAWLLDKMEKWLKMWSHKWLSRDGKLVLVKTVMEAIPVYWMSLAWIPKSILETACKTCFRFL